METWDVNNTPYSAGDIVYYNNDAWRKLDDADQTAPDLTPGGWELLPENNANEFLAIVGKFADYESRRNTFKTNLQNALVAAAIDIAEARAVLDSP